MNTEQGLEILKKEGIFWSRLGFFKDPPEFDKEGHNILNEEPEKYFKYHRDMTKAGIKVHTCILASGWKGPGEYDFKTSIEILERLMKENPNTYFLPRIKLNPPVSWQHENPKDLFVYEYGPEKAEEIAALVGSDKHNLMGDGEEGTLLANQSFSSEKWREDAMEYLDKFISITEQSEYSDRIIGYHLGYGRCGETHMWGDDRTLDFGINEKKCFFEYGIKKYGGKDILGEKWQIENVDENNVPIPKKNERYAETNSAEDFFHEGERYTAYRDYNMYRKEVSLETILMFAKFVKEKTNKAVGFFHGYILAEGADRHGHTDLTEVLESPYIDFICAPKSYYRNAEGEPGGYYAPPLSVNLKKLWIDEMDYPHKPGETKAFLNILWREFSKNMSMDTPFWWMDLLGGWYDSKQVQAEVKKLIDIKKAMPQCRESIAEVLLVTDENSSMYTTQNHIFQVKTMQESQAQTALSGMPYDMYRMSDLSGIDLKRYKVIFFLNCFAISDAQRNELYKKISKETVLIFNYAFGIRNEGLSLENVRRSTGFELAPRGERTSIPYFEIVRHDNVVPIYSFRDVIESERNNTGCAFADIPDVDAVAVAKTTRADGGTNIMAAIPALDSNFIRKITEEAGCRIYAPNGTTVYGDSRFLSFFAHDNISAKITAQEKYHDIINGTDVCGEIDLNLKKGDFVFWLKK